MNIISFQYNTMRSILVVCLFVVAVNGAASYHPYPNGYNIDIGIPLGKKVYEAESAIIRGSRVFGGRPSPLGAHPYLVCTLSQIQDFPSPSLATGSLLTNTKVLWAAHNWGSGTILVTVALGSEFAFFGGTRVTATRVNVHPQYNPSTIENDLAILTIPWVAYTNVIQPISLPFGGHQDNLFVGYQARIAGFGTTGAGIQANHTQHHANVTVISNDACRNNFGPFVFDSTICTQGAGLIGICGGDSGGPLSVLINNQPVQIGVHSFGSFCGSGSPSGHARVTSFLDWIVLNLYD